VQLPTPEQQLVVAVHGRPCPDATHAAHWCVLSLHTAGGVQVRGGVPARQPRAASQVSAPLHHSPSLQAASLGVWSHASVVSLHESTVQPTPSLQLGGVPGWQPSVTLQVSVPLQNRP